MKVTINYVGGLYDGNVVFDDETPESNLSERESVAFEHYRLTACGTPGQWFAAGSPALQDGAARYIYEVTRRIEDLHETTIYLTYRPDGL